jgi:hypothetical protein
MGYTHYWRNKTTISPEVWKDICRDAAKIIAASPVPLQWESDEKRPPEIKADNAKGGGPLIRFNGVDDDGHETFLVEPGAKVFDFCKTNGKPYDIVVTAMLAMIASRWPDFRVTSDGVRMEWQEGLDLARGALGRPIYINLHRDED